MARGPANGRAVPVPLDRVPWWALVLAGLLLLAAARLAGSEVYRETLQFLAGGVVVTLLLTVASFGLALVVRLVAALARLSRSAVLRSVATLYGEVVRGVPLLVLLLYHGERLRGPAVPVHDPARVCGRAGARATGPRRRVRGGER